MENKTIYLIWDVYECKYIRAIDAGTAEDALSVVKTLPEEFPDEEEMGYEAVPFLLHYKLEK